MSAPAQELDVGAVVAALRSVLPRGAGAGGQAVALHEPRFAGNEWRYLKECLDTGWVSSVGKFVDRFEADLAAYTGARRAVAVCNGTAALHVCLALAGVEAGDEVLLPTLTFVATANAVAYCGAVPHFVDSEERTFGVDPRRLAEHLGEVAEAQPAGRGCVNRRTGRRIRALVPVHVFGFPVDLDPLVELCARYQIELIEDATESLGTTYKGRHAGTVSRLAALSFNGNKIVTTGGGGAVLTSDEALGQRAKHLTTTAKAPHRWTFAHDAVGWNYRLPNLNAAVGCAQLEQLAGFVEAKRALAARYARAFAGVAGLRHAAEPEFARSNYWLNTLLLDRAQAARRDELLAATNDAGIMTRPVWTLMHRLPMYEACPRMDLTGAEDLERRVVNIPSSAALAIGEARDA